MLGRAKRNKAPDRPPRDKMVREEETERKAPAPRDEDELAHDEPEGETPIDKTVRQRGSWFPGDATL